MTDGDIKQFTSKYKADVIKAEVIIVRARQAAAVANKESTIDIGDFEVELVLCIIGKHPEKTDMDTVTAKFLKHYIEGAPVQEPHVPMSADKSSGDAHGNIVQYQGGSASGVGKLTVLQAGYTIGCFVEEKSSAKGMSHLTGQMFKLTSIADDGAVTLAPVDKQSAVQHGSLMGKTLQEFLADFRMSTMVGYDDRQSMSSCPDVKVEFVKSMVNIALSIAARNDCSKLAIQRKPEKRVLTTDAMSAEKFQITPLSTNIKHITESEVNQYQFIASAVVDKETYRFAVLSSTSKTHVCHAFVMKQVAKEEAANVNVISHKVVVPIKFGSKSTNHNIDVPVLVLKSDVSADIELTLHGKAKVQSAKRAVALEFGDEAPSAKATKKK